MTRCGLAQRGKASVGVGRTTIFFRHQPTVAGELPANIQHTVVQYYIPVIVPYCRKRVLRPCGSAEMGVLVDHCEETGTSLVLALIEHVDIRFLARLQ